MSLLAACDGAGNGSLAQRLNLTGQDDDNSAAKRGTSRTVEEDVEAPEVFAVTAQGLWDGRPSLGGIWVAHPDVGDPERVIIRNTSNGRSVVGALFRRERDVPGPVLQISSDAAAELDLVAGKPQELSVTALRRVDVPVEDETPEQIADETETTDTVAPPEEITQSTLDPVAIASAAIETAPDRAPGADGAATN